MKNIDTVSSTGPLLQLEEILNTLANETEDHRKSEDAVSALVEFVNNIHAAMLSNSEEAESLRQIAMKILTELLRFISSPSLDQVVVDALSFQLPKSIVKFAGVSNKFCEIVECLIERLISTCNPRDMLTVFCEVLLDCPGEMSNEPAYFIPLLTGLSKVFVSLHKRCFEHIKEALPAVLNVLQAVSCELDDENLESFMVLVGKGILIASSIQEVCKKLEGKQKEQLLALLGLFVLETMALVSSTLMDSNLNIPMMSQLSQYLPFCNLSYLGLVTGDDVEASTIILEETGDYMHCLSHVKQGAVIAVVWGIIPEIAKAASEDLFVLTNNLRSSQSKRWQTVGMLKYVLSSIDQPWQVKERSIDFFLHLVEGNLSKMSNTEYVNSFLQLTDIFSVVQAIEMVIIYAPHAELRKKAFFALKMVLADIPTRQRFDVLKASITNNSYSSMVAILIDIVKEELLIENNQKGLPKGDDIILEGDKVIESLQFWRKDVLELVEFVMRPPSGGPPTLPEQSDAVLSALNLYRFLLIKESTGKTNYTGILTKDTLQKAYREWFLPLRTLISGIRVESEGIVAENEMCGFNPLQLVLERCIELIEEELRHTA